MKCFVLQGTHISFRNKLKEEKVDELKYIKSFKYLEKKDSILS